MNALSVITMSTWCFRSMNWRENVAYSRSKSST